MAMEGDGAGPRDPTRHSHSPQPPAPCAQEPSAQGTAEMRTKIEAHAHEHTRAARNIYTYTGIKTPCVRDNLVNICDKPDQLGPIKDHLMTP